MQQFVHHSTTCDLWVRALSVEAPIGHCGSIVVLQLVNKYGTLTSLLSPFLPQYRTCRL